MCLLVRFQHLQVADSGASPVVSHAIEDGKKLGVRRGVLFQIVQPYLKLFLTLEVEAVGVRNPVGSNSRTIGRNPAEQVAVH